jgi:hypothetical protein
MIGVQEGDRQYRRGMVLGLTMAEIMLLLIFLLLLLLSAKLLDDRKLIAEAEKQRDEAVAAQLAAEEKSANLEKLLGPEKVNDKTIYQIFDEWQKAEKRADENERKYEEAKSALEVLEPVRKDKPAMTSEEAAAEAKRLIETAQSVERQAAEMSPGADPKDALDHLQEAAMIGQQAMAEGPDSSGVTCQKDLNQCQASNIDMSRRLALKGGTLPSCWIDGKTGRPQYIFDAELTDRGIILHDNRVVNREKEQAALPISPLAVERLYQSGEFVAAGQKLFQWSDSQDPACRFYVRLIDRTSNDKFIYKALKEKGVERVFYTLPD